MTERFGTCYQHHSHGPDRSTATNHLTYDQLCSRVNRRSAPDACVSPSSYTSLPCSGRFV